MTCRAPEIVATSVLDIEIDPNGIPYDKESGRLFLGSVEDLVNGKHTSYRCVNCGRMAHRCPTCTAQRCDADLFKSMAGSHTLTCRVCHPGGINQTMNLVPGGYKLEWSPK